MEVSALTIRSVIFPEADVDVSVTVDDAPETLLIVLVKVAVIPGPIGPNLRAFAVAHGAGPLASILYIALVDGLLSRLDDQSVLADQLFAKLVVPLELSQVLQLFLNDCVLVIRHILAVLA